MDIPNRNPPPPPPGARPVSATEVARNFASIVARVREDDAVYVVTRSGKPVAQIGPVAERTLTGEEFARLVREGSTRLAGREYLRAVEAGIARFNHPAVPESPWER
ncbi:MAG: type II toxin-antitoxin system prevent-host-death family antitoxin [Gemmatimonadetes bacterium]|nr:type II toxin-antitoxin system prevent-host-death family antitoxin [Gemmatimonadota bacterium]